MVQELHTVSVAQDVPVVGVVGEEKEPAFSAASKKRVITSVVSASVAEARTLTLVSSVYPSLLIVVEASSLSWVAEVGEAGVALENDFLPKKRFKKQISELIAY